MMDNGGHWVLCKTDEPQTCTLEINNTLYVDFKKKSMNLISETKPVDLGSYTS